MLLPELTQLVGKTLLAGMFGLAVLGLMLLGCVACDARAGQWPTPQGVVVVPVAFEVVGAPVSRPQEPRGEAVWVVLDDNDVPYQVPCSACPGGFREGTWAEVRSQRGFWLQRREDHVWAFAQTDEGNQVIQWVIYEPAGRRIVPNREYRRVQVETMQVVPRVQPVYRYAPRYNYWPAAGGSCPGGRCGG